MELSLIVLSLFLGAAASDAQSTASSSVAAVAGMPLPGDDFDGFVNGAWRAATPIPADRASTGVGYDVFNSSKAPVMLSIAFARDACQASATTASYRSSAGTWQSLMKVRLTNARGRSGDAVVGEGISAPSKE